MTDLLALRSIKADTGRYGESLDEATSPQADPTYYGAGAIRFLPRMVVNHAEAAVDAERKKLGDDIPAGATFYVERKTYD